ncbi:MAG TPA: beta-ketoacyl synthase N-terminal-like domain-containing protein [Pyrinomonadaceae bacterium]|nr:beta-ketoacyl synthase N-terminal-like domain-containing protein [Pyrinomonadaceae bacterium]
MVFDSGHVAIIGMSGRFPGASDLKQYWTNLAAGVESVSFFSDEQLVASGLSMDQCKGANYVPAKGMVDGACDFDAGSFDFSEREACLMDPQFRVFLEIVLTALEDAGDPGDADRRTGVFAGAGPNTYQDYLRSDSELVARAGVAQAVVANQVDFLSAWISYKLNLTGPSVTVQSACATSLAAVHLAAQSLLNGECDMAVAGGVSLTFPQQAGYLYMEGGLFSRDGHCRAFDAKASGFVPGEGAGAVVLKRLGDAIAEGHTIHAVIKGSAINNDGSNKIGFSAPSQSGMAAVIAEGIAISGVPCESIRMVEAHGTATTLGDPLEVAALTQAFRTQTDRKQFCSIGSVKTNIGHANAAAGIASLIKATLAVENGVIPPSLHYDQSNPVLSLPRTPFYVNSKAENWSDDGLPRRAAVNSFGIGGTNVHVVIEQTPPREPSGDSRSDQLVLLSTKTPSALDQAARQLANYLESTPTASLPDVAYTLATGRRSLEYRQAVLGESSSDIIQALQGKRPSHTTTRWDDGDSRTLTFLFPDRAAGYPNATESLYRDEPVFHDAMDCCANACLRFIKRDIREILYRPSENARVSGLNHDELGRAITVAVQYSLGKLLISLGLSQPRAFSGLGIGELTAASFSESLPIEEALSLACQGCEPGAIPQTDSPVKGATEAARSNKGIAAILDSSEQAVVVFSENDPLEVMGAEQAPRDLVCVSALRPVAASLTDRQWLLMALGKLWTANTPVDWKTYYSAEKRQRISLPTYPFERQRYWVNTANKEPALSAPTQSNGSVGSPSGSGRAAYAEPRNDLQAVVASVWEFHFGLDKVGINERFLDLGGNSILATRIVTTLRDTLQTDFPLRVLLENPTVLTLSEVIAEAAREWETDVHAIATVVREIQQLPAVA